MLYKKQLDWESSHRAVKQVDALVQGSFNFIRKLDLTRQLLILSLTKIDQYRNLLQIRDVPHNAPVGEGSRRKVYDVINVFKTST